MTEEPPEREGDEDDLDEEPTGEDLEPLDAEVVDPDDVAGPPGRRPGGRVLVSEMTARTSPFPEGEWLETADRLAPGTTERLVTDFVEQQKHGRAMDRRAARLDEKSFGKFADYQSRQQHLAGLVAILGLVLAGVIAVTGGPIWGFATVVGELAVLAGVFVYGRRRAEPGGDGGATGQELEDRARKEADQPPDEGDPAG